MDIKINSGINFMRLLKPSEMKDYKTTLEKGIESVTGYTNYRSILILPVSSLPQDKCNNTGVGNLCSEEAQKFIDFSKLYWGINEIQILPIGQYHLYNGECPIYSGTTMNLGNHIINLKDFISPEKFQEIVRNNALSNKVNFQNVIEQNSSSERALHNLYKSLPQSLKDEFENYKKNIPQIIEKKSLYRALREINNSHDYKEWNELDSKLFDNNKVNKETRDKRIAEVYKLKPEVIDFYKFKDFLAEKSFKKSKDELNKKGIKLIGDMPIGFTYDECWSNPNAFRKDVKMKEWGLPILDVNSKEAEEIIREKTAFYAKHFDGFRVDASWAYITPNTVNIKTGYELKLDNGEKLLNIIDEEIKRIKGENYDMKNITHEFAANPSTQFNIYNSNSLKPSVKDRVKIYTSEYLNYDWGSADSYKKRGWGDEYFIIGATNHDSAVITPQKEQIEVLSKILDIPKEKLNNPVEFLKAKLAEPLRAKNSMLFFATALGLDGQYNHNKNKTDNYTLKIPENFADFYSSALKSGRGYNPMDALEKQFKAQGLDKEEPALYKKIVKYKRILEDKKSGYSALKIIVPVVLIITAALCFIKYYKNHSVSSSKYVL